MHNTIAIEKSVKQRSLSNKMEEYCIQIMSESVKIFITHFESKSVCLHLGYKFSNNILVNGFKNSFPMPNAHGNLDNFITVYRLREKMLIENTVRAVWRENIF